MYVYYHTRMSVLGACITVADLGGGQGVPPKATQTHRFAMSMVVVVFSFQQVVKHVLW